MNRDGTLGFSRPGKKVSRSWVEVKRLVGIRYRLEGHDMVFRGWKHGSVNRTTARRGFGRCSSVLSCISTAHTYGGDVRERDDEGGWRGREKKLKHSSSSSSGKGRESNGVKVCSQSILTLFFAHTYTLISCACSIPRISRHSACLRSSPCPSPSHIGKRHESVILHASR